MSLKRIFSDKIRKCRPEEVGIALILAALAVFGFSRTPVIAAGINGNSITTDAVAITPHEKVEKIAAEKKNSAGELKSSFKSAAAVASSPRGTSASSTTSASNAGGTFVTVNGVNIPMFNSSSTSVDPGSRAALYNGRFLYGHRGTAFGGIAVLPNGAQITITRNGATETYVVVNSTTLDRDTTARFMYALTEQGSYKGQSYGLVLMTCAGAPGDNGDASHRTIVFANRI